MQTRRTALAVPVAVVLAVVLALSASAKPGKTPPRWGQMTVPTVAPDSTTTTAAPSGGGGSGTSSTTTTAAPVATTTTSAPATTTTTAPPTATRQAARWPFSATSPWNIGVGSGATFASATDARTLSLVDPTVTAWVNAGRYSHPVYQASAGDPLATVRRSGYPDQVYRIPDGARPADGTDMHMHVVEPDGRWLHESWLMQGANPSWTTGYHVKTDLWSSGFGAGGVRAFGGSAVGGLIKRWELDEGRIPHAIALAITGNQLKLGPVWPATTQDGNASSTYFGQVPMGTFAAIPPSVDVEALPLSREGRILARALQDHGAYVVDRAGAFTAVAEPSLDGTTALANLRTALTALRPHLRVVTNNGASSVNGGGTYDVPTPPPFG